jgi:hypothetical protein
MSLACEKVLLNLQELLNRFQIYFLRGSFIRIGSLKVGLEGGAT